MRVDRPEASAVVAGHRRLFLREAQQLLPDGLDQGGGRVSGGGGLEGRHRGQVAHARGVDVHGGSRGLLDNASGCLEDRAVRVVRTIQELKVGGGGQMTGGREDRSKVRRERKHRLEEKLYEIYGHQTTKRGNMGQTNSSMFRRLTASFSGSI